MGMSRGCPGLFPGVDMGTRKGFLDGQWVPRDTLGWARAGGGAGLPQSGKSNWKSRSPQFWVEPPQTHLEEAGQGWEGQQSPFGDQKPSALTHQLPPPVTPGCSRAPQGRGAPETPGCHPGGGNSPGATGLVTAATCQRTGRRPRAGRQGWLYQLAGGGKQHGNYRQGG